MQTEPTFGPNGMSFPNAVAAFNFLSYGYERKSPSIYRDWSEVRDDPIRPRMFRATPYRGITKYYPVPGFSPSAGRSVDISLRASSQSQSNRSHATNRWLLARISRTFCFFAFSVAMLIGMYQQTQRTTS